jgi:hypothetical protein
MTTKHPRACSHYHFIMCQFQYAILECWLFCPFPPQNPSTRSPATHAETRIPHRYASESAYCYPSHHSSCNLVSDLGRTATVGLHGARAHRRAAHAHARPLARPDALGNPHLAVSLSVRPFYNQACLLPCAARALLVADKDCGLIEREHATFLLVVTVAV